jgi:hypothetical protein
MVVFFSITNRLKFIEHQQIPRTLAPNRKSCFVCVSTMYCELSFLNRLLRSSHCFYWSAILEKSKSRFMRLHAATCLWIPLMKFWMSEPIFMKLGICIMVPEHISTAYFVNPSHHLVCLYWYPPIVAATTNTHATMEELLDASFSMRSVSY